MPPQPELATETWISIISLLSPTDLARLCLTSTLYLSITRPILYRSVNLPGVESTFKTLTLLSSDTSLAEHIHELTISPPIFDSKRNLLEALLEILPLLTNMKKFSIIESAIFPRGQERFLKIMKEKNPPLKEFSYVESSSRIVLMLLQNRGRLNLSTFAGLKKLSWSIYMDQRIASPKNSRAALCQVLSASSETIESITIDPYIWGSDFFWGMRFPVLKRLELRLVWFFPGDIPFPLAKFLNAHPGIEELRIGPNRYHVKDDDVHPLTWGKVAMTNSDDTSSIPPILLRSYTGSIEGFICLFARENGLCRLGDSLEELVFELDQGNPGGLGEKIRTLNRVLHESREVLGKLKRLDFSLMPFEHADCHRFPTLLADALEIAQLCASTIEYYRGPIPKSYDELLTFLDSLPHLKELHVRARHVWGGGAGRLKENEREGIIAGVCELLENIIIISNVSDSDVICRKKMVRAKPGNEVLRIETYWQRRMF